MRKALVKRGGQIIEVDVDDNHVNQLRKAQMGGEPQGEMTQQQMPPQQEGQAQGSQEDQIMQLIQAYAEAMGIAPEEIIQELQQMDPQEQKQAIDQMAQELQGGQQAPEQQMSPEQMMQMGGASNIYIPDTGTEQYAPDATWYEGGDRVATPGNVVSWPSFPEGGRPMRRDIPNGIATRESIPNESGREITDISRVPGAVPRRTGTSTFYRNPSTLEQEYDDSSYDYEDDYNPVRRVPFLENVADRVGDGFDNVGDFFKKLKRRRGGRRGGRIRGNGLLNCKPGTKCFKFQEGGDSQNGSPLDMLTPEYKNQYFADLTKQFGQINHDKAFMKDLQKDFENFQSGGTTQNEDGSSFYDYGSGYNPNKLAAAGKFQSNANQFKAKGDTFGAFANLAQSAANTVGKAASKAIEVAKVAAPIAANIAAPGSGMIVKAGMNAMDKPKGGTGAAPAAGGAGGGNPLGALSGVLGGGGAGAAGSGAAGAAAGGFDPSALLSFLGKYGGNVPTAQNGGILGKVLPMAAGALGTMFAGPVGGIAAKTAVSGITGGGKSGGGGGGFDPTALISMFAKFGGSNNDSLYKAQFGDGGRERKKLATSPLNEGTSTLQPGLQWVNDWISHPRFTKTYAENWPNHEKITGYDKLVSGSRNNVVRDREEEIYRNTAKWVPDLLKDVNRAQVFFNTDDAKNAQLELDYYNTLSEEDKKVYDTNKKKQKRQPQGYTDLKNRSIHITNEAGKEGQSDPNAVLAHELVHYIEDDTGKTTLGGLPIYQPLGKSYSKFFAMPPESKWLLDDEGKPDKPKKDEFLPFLWQLRQEHGITGDDYIDQEWINKIRKTGDKNPLLQYYDDNQLIEYLNTLVNNSPGKGQPQFQQQVQPRVPYDQYGAYGGTMNSYNPNQLNAFLKRGGSLPRYQTAGPVIPFDPKSLMPDFSNANSAAWQSNNTELPPVEPDNSMEAWRKQMQDNSAATEDGKNWDPLEFSKKDMKKYNLDPNVNNVTQKPGITGKDFMQATQGMGLATAGIFEAMGNKRKARKAQSRAENALLADNLFTENTGDMLDRGDYVTNAQLANANFRPDDNTPMGYNASRITKYGAQIAKVGTQVQNPYMSNPYSHPEAILYGEPDPKVSNTLKPVKRENANLEAEIGEVAITPAGTDGVPKFFKIGGKNHYEGGTPLNLPENTFIYSKTRSMIIKDPKILKELTGSTKPASPADLAKKFDYSDYVAVLQNENSDPVERKTAQIMIESMMYKLGQIAIIQEAKKGFPSGIPLIAVPYLEKAGIDPQMLLPQTEQPEMDPRMQEQMDPAMQQQMMQQQMDPRMMQEQMEPMPEEMMMPPMARYGGSNLERYQTKGQVLTPEQAAAADQALGRIRHYGFRNQRGEGDQDAMAGYKAQIDSLYGNPMYDIKAKVDSLNNVYPTVRTKFTDVPWNQIFDTNKPWNKNLIYKQQNIADSNPEFIKKYFPEQMETLENKPNPYFKSYDYKKLGGTNIMGGPVLPIYQTKGQVDRNPIQQVGSLLTGRGSIQKPNDEATGYWDRVGKNWSTVEWSNDWNDPRMDPRAMQSLKELIPFNGSDGIFDYAGNMFTFPQKTANYLLTGLFESPMTTVSRTSQMGEGEKLLGDIITDPMIIPEIPYAIGKGLYKGATAGFKAAVPVAQRAALNTALAGMRVAEFTTELAAKYGPKLIELASKYIGKIPPERMVLVASRVSQAVTQATNNRTPVDLDVLFQQEINKELKLNKPASTPKTLVKPKAPVTAPAPVRTTQQPVKPVTSKPVTVAKSAPVQQKSSKPTTNKPKSSSTQTTTPTTSSNSGLMKLKSEEVIWENEQ